MKVHYPKLYNMAHLFTFNVLLISKDLTIIFYFSPGSIHNQDIFRREEYIIVNAKYEEQGREYYI